MQSVLDEIDNHLVVTTGSGWTYARDIVSVIRDAFGANRKADSWQQVAPCDQGAAICRFVHAWMDGVWPDAVEGGE